MSAELDQKLDRLRQQKAQIDKRISRLAAQKAAKIRKTETRRKIIAGALALAHAEFDAGFKSALMSLLDRQIKKPDERALFGLPPLTTEGETWNSSSTSPGSA